MLYVFYHDKNNVQRERNILLPITYIMGASEITKVEHLIVF